MKLSLPRTAFKVSGTLVLCFIVALAGIYFFIVSSPATDGKEINVIIDSGQSVKSIATELKRENVVKSSTVVQSLMVMSGGERSIKAGMYSFKSPQNVFTVAHRIVSGDYGYVPIKLTVPEGTNAEKLASLVNSKFPHIATSTIGQLAWDHEGYLFPETYFFAPMVTPEIIIERMEDTFTNKLRPLEGKIKDSGRSREDIIKMASILEAEVQTDADRRMVADLLWRRLDNGMALQVDSTLGYILGKASLELTTTDLKVNSPYNSYTHKGLPPAPISNPGLVSIQAALSPTHNAYVFYLSDKNGITHFAKTYEEHLKNKNRYLR